MVEKILAERKTTHGEYVDNAGVTWDIMRIIQAEASWPELTDGQKHALYMVAHKVGRIVTGKHSEIDHWQDIAGYAMLVAQRLEKPVERYRMDPVGAAAIGWGVSRVEAETRMRRSGTDGEAWLSQMIQNAANETHDAKEQLEARAMAGKLAAAKTKGKTEAAQ